MHCYVYFKAHLNNQTAVLQCLTRLQTSLRQLGLKPEVQKRPNAHDGIETWMEIYRDIPEDFEETLAKTVSQSGLYSHIIGKRHLEYFVTVTV
ncbi:DUF4936 family protein [Undibacterium cyanobacteriorum]|uniref:DUF4936 family protein n=1 Tax=Undibacterium cyanobacteriorum TaxID=3073561 RepID=A0ABY9RCK6_9BURK|nr:DUF4936 family protein [Undibacterium sp. 20NA77.5]WMW78899.1 DUF4936 family protein [Undibacterium sp. 20NA77.5]